ncbi:MAG TPA: hypothetical protein VGR40_00225 [Candidatus Binatus sp.]|nr:hypothetical protein [Candidatus Binatus sp.]
MGKGDRGPIEQPNPRLGLSTALLAMLLGALAISTSGCLALPFLSAIPSAASFIYNVATGKTDSDSKNPDQDAEAAAEEPAKPPAQLTPDNICHLMAIARPDLIVVQLRKNATGAPEYRELRLQSGADDAHWTPVVDSDGGPDGWRPAVNFLKMDFKPALTEVIPDTGTCYLEYAPIAADPTNPVQPVEAKASPGNAAGDFAWEGREYQYRVEPTLPCLSPSS